MQNEPEGVPIEWLHENSDKLKKLVAGGEKGLQWCMECIEKSDEANRRHYLDWKDSSIKYLQERFDKSTNYTNLIMITGYAGFFGLWNMMEGDLSPLYHSLTGLCFVFSLFFFVFSEVFGMREEYYRNKKYVETEKDGNIDSEINKFNEIEKEFGDRNERVWKWHFYPAGTIGLLGVTILFGDLLSNLVGNLWLVLR